MPVIGSPLACNAPSTNNRIKVKQYTAILLASNIGLLDTVIPPTAGKSLRLSGVCFVATATTNIQLASLNAINLPVTINTSTSIVTTTGSAPHSLSTGDVIVFAGTTAAAGSSFNTPYHAKVLTTTTFELYDTTENALTGASGKILFTAAGTAVRLSYFGSLLMTSQLQAGSGYSYPVSLSGDFLFQCNKNASLAIYADTAVPHIRFSVYEV